MAKKKPKVIPQEFEDYCLECDKNEYYDRFIQAMSDHMIDRSHYESYLLYERHQYLLTHKEKEFDRDNTFLSLLKKNQVHVTDFWYWQHEAQNFVEMSDEDNDPDKEIALLLGLTFKEYTKLVNFFEDIHKIKVFFDQKVYGKDIPTKIKKEISKFKPSRLGMCLD